MYIISMSAHSGDVSYESRMGEIVHAVDFLRDLKGWYLAFTRTCESAGWRREDVTEYPLTEDDARLGEQLQSMGLKRTATFRDPRRPDRRVIIDIRKLPRCATAAEDAAHYLMR